jgi:type VI secretion system protein ImpE
MSAAESKLRAGDLAGCLTDLQEEVRKNPADPKPRIFLAQLLMVTGEWERALGQLAVAAELDASAVPMAHSYRAAIRCERLRGSVIRGEHSPLIFGDPEPWIALMVQALAALATGQAQAAAEMRTEAFAAAPTTGGSINGVDFEWIADADSRFGPILEALLNGSYYWVPFHRIAAITLEPPADLRDLVWLPAQFTWSNGGEAMGFIPTRYEGSERAEDPQLRLSRKTEWAPLGGAEGYSGRGQRVLATSAEDFPLLEVRQLLLKPVGS